MDNLNIDTLRPESFQDFVGQKRLVNRLLVHANAAVAEQRPLEHVLLHGPPGFGKTTLAGLISGQLADPLLTLTMPVNERVLQAAVAGHDGVLFLDEIHAASKRIQESLLPLLEFGHVQTRSGYKIEAGFLTIVGATTEIQGVIPPLVDRFKIKPILEPYTPDEMALITIGMAIKADLGITEDDAMVLGGATGGTPRNAGQFILAGRALMHAIGRTPTADEILEFCDTDRQGLGRLHYQYLQTLAKFGGTRGLAQIATAMQQSQTVLVELERLLFRHDLITFGSGGRELTQAGYTKVKGERGGHRRDA